MDRKTRRFCLYVAACSVAGIVLGGTASQAELSHCLETDSPSNECLSQDPTMKLVEGMSFGLIAGAGAAVGATWQIWQRDE